jgi:hypothetical protein
MLPMANGLSVGAPARPNTGADVLDDFGRKWQAFDPSALDDTEPSDLAELQSLKGLL